MTSKRPVPHTISEITAVANYPALLRLAYRCQLEEMDRLSFTRTALGTHPLGSFMRRWPKRDAQRELQNAWRLAERRLRENRAQIEPHLEQLRRASAQPWTGQSGGSDLAVLQAIERLARRYGRLPVVAPVGEVAVIAGVARTTARRSLRRLCHDGWLVQVKGHTQTMAATYDLGPMVSVVVSTTAPVQVELGCEAARRSGVGRAKVRLWSLLVETPQTTNSLAHQLGRAPGTIRRQLGQLAQHDLAERRGGGWSQGPATLEEVADRLGLKGVEARERDRLVRYRTGRRLALETLYLLEE